MVKIFNLSTANSLLVSDKPITQPDANIQELNLSEIYEKFSFTYSEDVELSDNLTSEDEGLGKEHKDLRIQALEAHLIQNVLERIRHSLNTSLIVCRIDEEVGYGVFTAAPIEAGSVIGLYAGQLCNRRGDHSIGDYGYGINKSNAIDAFSVGGITRFIQHMPTYLMPIYQQIDDADFKNLKKIASTYSIALPPDPDFEPSIEQLSPTKDFIKGCIENEHKGLGDVNSKMQAMLDAGLPIASANTMWAPFIYQGRTLQCLVAMRAIAANEQLGVDYGPNYWGLRRISPKYFHKNTGAVLSPSELLLRPESRKANSAFDLTSGLFASKPKHNPNMQEKEKQFRNAANRGQESIVSQLIIDGVNINSASPSNGKTALHYATLNKHYRIVRLLIESDVNREIRDNENKLSIDYAQGDAELMSIFSTSPKIK
jgi:hypothetical protein